MKTPQDIAQWVIDNRYTKSENEKVSDVEMYNTIYEAITKLINNETHFEIIPQMCDVCGCKPLTLIKTHLGTFCQLHAKYV
jgi:hypothetical protein